MKKTYIVSTGRQVDADKTYLEGEQIDLGEEHMPALLACGAVQEVEAAAEAPADVPEEAPAAEPAPAPVEAPAEEAPAAAGEQPAQEEAPAPAAAEPAPAKKKSK